MKLNMCLWFRSACFDFNAVKARLKGMGKQRMASKIIFFWNNCKWKNSFTHVLVTPILKVISWNLAAWKRLTRYSPLMHSAWFIFLVWLSCNILAVFIAVVAIVYPGRAHSVVLFLDYNDLVFRKGFHSLYYPDTTWMSPSINLLCYEEDVWTKLKETFRCFLRDS